MKTTPLKKLIQQHDEICNEIITKFSNKQELEFDGWVADEIGGIASFIQQYFFNLSDIVLDLRTKQPKGFILQWQDDGTDYNILRDNQHYINYKSYIKGLRYADLNKKSSINEIQERLKQAIEKAKPNMDKIKNVDSFINDGKGI